MSDEPKLMPCPFCGGENMRHFNSPDEFGRPSHGIQCANGDCWISGPQCETEEQAIAAWNRRVPAPAVPDDVSKMVRALRFYSEEDAWPLRIAAADALEAQAAELALAKAETARFKAANDMLIRNMSETQAVNLRIGGAADALVNNPGWGTVNYTDGDMWADADKLRAAIAHTAAQPAPDASLVDAARAIIRLMNIHPQGRDLSWFQRHGMAVNDLEAALATRDAQPAPDAVAEAAKVADDIEHALTHNAPVTEALFLLAVAGLTLRNIAKGPSA